MFKNTSFTHRGQSNPGTALRYGIQTYPFSTLGGGDRRRHRNEGIFALLIFWSLAFHILIQQAVTVFTQFTTFHTCVVYQKKYPALFDRSGICKVWFWSKHTVENIWWYTRKGKDEDSLLNTLLCILPNLTFTQHIGAVLEFPKFKNIFLFAFRCWHIFEQPDKDSFIKIFSIFRRSALELWPGPRRLDQVGLIE